MVVLSTTYVTLYYTSCQFLQVFSIIINRGIISLGIYREVVDVLNITYKSFILQLMSTVQLPGEKGQEKQMVMHTGTRTSNDIFVREFKQHLYHTARKN